MKQILTALLVLLSFATSATRKVIPKNGDGGWYFITVSPVITAILPGDTIIVTGDYAYAYVKGLTGTLAQPITIITLTTARFGTNGSYGLILDSCAHVIIDGRVNGVANRLQFGPASGTYIPQTFTPHNSSYIEFRYCEVMHGQVGILARPSTGPDIYNLWIHNNLIHDMRGLGSCEGTYIGNTGLSDTTKAMFRNLIYEDNTLYDLGGDGIQVCCAPGFIIRRNTVTDFGKQSDIGTHCTGLLLGGNANGLAEYNTITNGRGSGMQVLGYGTVTVNYCSFTNTGTGVGFFNGQQIVEQPDAIYISKRGGIGSAKLTVNMDHVIVNGGWVRYGIFNDGNNTLGGIWNCVTITGTGFATYRTNSGDVFTNVNCTPTPTPPPACNDCFIIGGTAFKQL